MSSAHPRLVSPFLPHAFIHYVPVRHAPRLQAGEKHLNREFKKKPRVTEVHFTAL